MDLSPLSAMAQMSGVLSATGMPDPMSESNKRKRSFQGTQAAVNLKRQQAGPSPSESHMTSILNMIQELQFNSTPKRIVAAIGSSARRTLEEKNPSSSSTEKSIQDKFIGMTV